MKVTEVHLTPIRPMGGMIAMARLVLNDVLLLDGIGVHEKLAGGYRLTYPTKNGRNLCHPISRELSQSIEQAICDEISNHLKDVKDDRHGGFDPKA